MAKKTFKEVTIHSFPNGVELKVENMRFIIVEDPNDKESSTMAIKKLIPDLVIEQGKTISSSESYERGILMTQIGISVGSLQLLHFAIGNFLQQKGIMLLPLKTELE
jgi:hypothetical protein